MARRILRDDRYYPDVVTDQRSSYERDRDRIVYSSAFRRLAGITQVVSVTDGHTYHNRLTHTIKVAQIARRLAEYAIKNNQDVSREVGIDPDVVETAALSHDLGHPPFGHVGEEELNNLVESNGNKGGFEGNAQSFRTVTKMAVRFREPRDGLNLTRASLRAVLKYPWLRVATDPKKSKKWGAYKEDKEAFAFATAGKPREEKSAEAELMDWADDVAYSVHDLEDFYRAGLIPWSFLKLSSEEIDNIVNVAVGKWWNPPSNARIRLERAADRILDILPLSLIRPYEGERVQRFEMRWWTSRLIDRFFFSITPRRPTRSNGRTVEIEGNAEDEVRFLKAITWKYVITNTGLAAQQAGQRQIIKELYEILFEIAKKRRQMKAYPSRFREQLDQNITKELRARLVADTIASLTEHECIVLHKRLTGDSVGAFFDPITL